MKSSKYLVGTFVASLAVAASVVAQSFGPVVNIANTPGNCSIACHGTQHHMEVVPPGIVHALWAESEGTDSTYVGGVIVYNRSPDFGNTWVGLDTIAVILDPPSQDTSRGPDQTALAAEGQNVHAVWLDVQEDPSITYGWIDYARSTDGGVTWSAPVVLAEGVGFGEPAVATESGYVHVVWTEPDGIGTALGYRRSTDNGATWQPAYRIFDQHALGTTARWPDIDAEAGRVHVVFIYDAWLGNDRISYLRSPDAGGTWGSQVDVTSGVVPYGYPSIEAGGDTVHVAWDEGFTIDYARSVDGGATFGPPTLVADMSGSGWAKAPSVTEYGGFAYIFWASISTAFDWEINLNYSLDNGGTWLAMGNASANTDYWSILPSAASYDSCACVLWSDAPFTTTNMDVYWRKFCLSPTSIGASEGGASSKAALRALPNPFGSSFALVGVAEGTPVTLYDASGRAVYEGRSSARVGVALPAGVYRVRVGAGRDAQTLTVVKR